MLLLQETHLVAAMVARMIDRHGSKSLDAIAQHCEMATAIGDQPSLHAWRDIATAVELLQGLSAATAEATDVVFSPGHGERAQHLALAEISG